MIDEEEPHAGEVWRDVPGVPGILVSSEGRVMKLPYRKTTKDGGERIFGGVPHFGTWDRESARFVVTVGGRTYKLAKLIALAFHGPAPFDGALVLHVDENSANNRPANLYYGSQRDNLGAPGFVNHCRSRTGENNPLVIGRRRRESAWPARVLQGNMLIEFDAALTDTGPEMARAS
jgi:hypothetical protein